MPSIYVLYSSLGHAISKRCIFRELIARRISKPTGDAASTTREIEAHGEENDNSHDNYAFHHV